MNVDHFPNHVFYLLPKVQEKQNPNILPLSPYIPSFIIARIKHMNHGDRSSKTEYYICSMYHNASCLINTSPYNLMNKPMFILGPNINDISQQINKSVQKKNQI